jgi:hypothetical protein
MKDEFKLMRKVNDEWDEVEKGSLERIQEYEPEFTLMRMFEDESQWVFLKSGKFNTCKYFEIEDKKMFCIDHRKKYWQIAKYKIVPRGTFIY